MVTCKVIRTCFFANRLFEAGEEVTFEDSVEIPEHFEVLGGEVKSKTGTVKEKKAAPAEASADTPKKEEAASAAELKKPAAKSKTATRNKTQK